MTARPPIDVERLRARLGGRFPRVDVVAETASTNADLLADPAAPDRSVLVAEYQNAGRGRFDRGWVSPPRAGLTFSVLLRPPRPRARWGWLPLLTGVAVAEAVRDATGLDTALKWPNDVLAADGRKLAGILVQTVEGAAVVGVGMNVSTEASELPVATATSLRLAGADVDRTDLLVACLVRIDERVRAWATGAADSAAAAYRQLCATLGAPVRVTGVGGAALEGIAVDLDPSGQLLLQTADGVRAVGAGDVEHVRPAGSGAFAVPDRGPAKPPTG